VTRTLSEDLFERFCTERRIRCRSVAVDKRQNRRTPDYDIFLPRKKVVTEIKELTPNAAERAAEAQLKLGKFSVVSLTPGERVRGKISDAGPQIRARAKYKYPGLLVLFDTGRIGSYHTDPYQIRVAMYGLEAIVIAVPNSPRFPPRAIGRKYGPRRKMTPNDNTSISAIGVLALQSGIVHLTIYHNDHAAIPLAPALFARYGVPQFRLESASQGAVADWVHA
jgi:hypothetical protein